MGIHNRQRRAAKQRKRAKARSGRPAAGPAGASGWYDERQSHRSHDSADAARLLMPILAEVEADIAAAARYARFLTGPDSPLPGNVVAAALEELTRSLLAAAVRGGWLPTDLGEVTRRRLTEEHVPMVAARLAAEADRHPPARVAAAWLQDLADLGPARAVDPATPTGLELTLGLCAVLTTLPSIATLIPPPGAASFGDRARSGIDGKLLERVRSLLAKAEATEFEEEAEALSAKAQDLISRYALDRMACQDVRRPRDEPMAARRLWIDPPYVLAKAMLIDAVARANRCRMVVEERLGVSTVVGAPGDLEAVELLATSLLVQASTAMVRCGRHADRGGTSRTRSFRRSFLLAYASRIGERLRATTEAAVADSGRVGELVPVLRQHERRVNEAFAEMFPATVARQTSITNGSGWAAGRAAADLALLNTRAEVTDAAAG